MGDIRSLCNRTKSILRRADKILQELRRAIFEDEDIAADITTRMNEVVDDLEGVRAALESIEGEPDITCHTRRLALSVARAITCLWAAAVKADPNMTCGDVVDVAMLEVELTRSAANDVCKIVAAQKGG
jgi:hypothetical protein